MAEITIRAFAKFREMFGAENVISVSDGSTVLDSLLQFAKTVSAAEDEIFECGVLKSHIVLMYNRERIDSEDAAEIAVEDGDEVVLYPPVSGG